MTFHCPCSDLRTRFALFFSFVALTVSVVFTPMMAVATTSHPLENSSRFASNKSSRSQNCSEADQQAKGCLRGQIFQDANQNKNSLGYSEARRAIYFDVDIRYSSEGVPFILSAYSNDMLLMNTKQMPSADKFNIEHTWPQSKLKAYPGFGATKADLHHLYAVESRINGTRGNLPFCNAAQGKQDDESINDDHSSSAERQSQLGNNCFEPPQDQKGLVARAMFYMSIAYNMEIDSAQEKVLRQWNAEVPVSEFEFERARRIEEIQGNINPFIQNSALAEMISDF